MVYDGRLAIRMFWFWHAAVWYDSANYIIRVLGENENQSVQVRQLLLHHKIKCLYASMCSGVQTLQGPPEWVAPEVFHAQN